MISDSLEVAIADLDYYLHDQHYGIYYTGQTRADLLSLVEDMKNILKTLDQPHNKIMK